MELVNNNLNTNKRLSFINNSGNSNTTSTTNNHYNTYNYKTLECSLEKKLETKLESIIFTKLNIKFDSVLCQINKTLEGLVDAKVQKYLISSSTTPNAGEIRNEFTRANITQIIEENIKTIVQEALKRFPLLLKVSEIAKEISSTNEPTIHRIKQAFNAEKDGNEYLTADILSYFHVSIIDPVSLAKNMENEVTENIQSDSFKRRYDLLSSNRNLWLDFIRCIWRHKKVIKFVESKETSKIDNELTYISDTLALQSHSIVFGINKLTCFVTDDPKSEDDSNDYIEEFSLPSITGITYDDYFLYKFLDFSKEIKRAILSHRKNRKHYDCKGRENYISKRKLKKSGGAREDEKENIDNMCKLL